MGTFKMTIEQFLSLTIEQRVEVLNWRLQSGETLSSIASEFRIARSSLQAPFKAAGFKYNKVSKQYEYDDLMTSPLSSSEILRKLDKIERLIKKYMVDDENVPYKEINEIISKIPSGKEIRVTIRINEEVWVRFDKFCNKNRNIYKKDLIDIALLELVRNYHDSIL